MTIRTFCLHWLVLATNAMHCDEEGRGTGHGSNPACSTTTTETCLLDGSEYTYAETSDGVTRTIAINGCPNHYSLAAGTLNPNVAVK